MKRQAIQDYVDSLNGKSLDDLSLVCEMMTFTFGDIAIHSQCFTRIIRKEQVLVTTLDHQNWDGENEENNDERYNLSLYKNLILHNRVTKALLTSTNDVLIWLENDIAIQIWISNGTPHYAEDCEQWRIFQINNEDSPHIVVYASSIEEE